jgi:hypothetical protein
MLPTSREASAARAATSKRPGSDGCIPGEKPAYGELALVFLSRLKRYVYETLTYERSRTPTARRHSCNV